MSTRARRGRHRLGPPHLRHCRQLPAVQARLAGGDRTRHASGKGTYRVRPAYAVGVAVAAAVLSGWFTAGEALAQQLAGH